MKVCINLFSCFLKKSTFTPVVGPCGQPASAPQAPGASHGDKGGTTRRQEKIKKKKNKKKSEETQRGERDRETLELRPQEHYWKRQKRGR